MVIDGKDSRTVELRNNTVVMMGKQHNKSLEQMSPKDTGLDLFVIKSLTLETYDSIIQFFPPR